MTEDNRTHPTPEVKGRQVILFTIWIFVMMNYLFCDVMTLMDPTLLRQIIKGVTAGGIQMNQGFLMSAAIVMEIPMVMILLTRILKQGANRVANIIAGTIMTIVQISSLFAGTPTLYYIFFSIIEISCTAFIAGYAWKWRNSGSWS